MTYSAWPPAIAALREQDALRRRRRSRPRRRPCTSGAGCSRPPTRGPRRCPGSRRSGCAARSAAGARLGKLLQRRAVVEREPLELPGVVEPQALELFEPLGVIGARGCASGRGPRAGCRAPIRPARSGPSPRSADAACSPASHRGRSRAAEHRVELRLAAGRAGVGERRGEALALDRALRVALEHVRAARCRAGRRASARCRRRGCTGDAPRRAAAMPGRPADDAHVRRAALVAGEALPVRERRVERPGPAVAVVVVGERRAELVEAPQVLLDVVGDAVEELVLVERPVRAALAARAVVGDDDDDRVLELPGLLEVVDQPAELVVGVADEARRRPRPSARTASARPR